MVIGTRTRVHLAYILIAKVIKIHQEYSSRPPRNNYSVFSPNKQYIYSYECKKADLVRIYNNCPTVFHFVSSFQTLRRGSCRSKATSTAEPGHSARRPRDACRRRRWCLQLGVLPHFGNRGGGGCKKSWLVPPGNDSNLK
jgi:hypothetical protein